MSEAGIDASSWLGETKFVVVVAPFQLTMDDDVKLHPKTAREKLPPPATAELGSNDEIVGAPDDGHALGVGIGVGVRVGLGVGVGDAEGMVPCVTPLSLTIAEDFPLLALDPIEIVALNFPDIGG
jgi:hypothetical protein